MKVSRLAQVLSPLTASRPASWFFLNVANPIDKRLIPATNGRLSTAPGTPVLVIEHVGAKSGKRRRTPLTYVRDGDDLALIASAGGSTKHPAWCHNLRAHPEVRVWARRRSGRYRAQEVAGEDRERLWRKATALYPGYDTYQVRAGSRRIPVFRLTPVGES